ncbi:patatin-domain-containing protein [Artomyces pyxidatus]|uniref:Patatin-domain-containing protein n=1 Tax=Artomyces pyxidatus TaxID=48021 RepID=A0ACB8TK56_9AGAM|nr:patatin-domain-containing protein [Artomyces pyxidatus]
MSTADPPKRRATVRSAGQELATGDWVNEAHMKAFEEALKADDNAVLPDNIASPSLSSYPGTPSSSGHHPGSTRIRKVSALSDFAPVNVKVKKRKKGSNVHHKSQEWLFLLLRWPLLFFIFLFIACEFGLYVLIRQLVNAKEWISAWRGTKGLLRKRLRASTTYEEWKEAAEVLDEHLKYNDWKHVDEDPYYDWRLVRKVNRSLKVLREKNDARGILGVLETCIRANFAAVESSRLYSETFYGSKDLVESYITEQEAALQYIRDTPLLSNDEKKRFFKSANTNLGLTALCLSGGASFAYYHFGVVKAFLDAGLLPRVLTGTSAGGLVAALVCTRTDAELKTLLEPELANKITACEEPFKVWFRRFWTTGARFDSVAWAKKACWFTRGSMTFREAYVRTGRVLNVSVVPADRHSPTKLLNYITAPDTIIWSALLASAAVPGILNPVVLMQKLKDGRVVPWNWGSKFKDGSLRVDIPVQALNLYFNVTHPVVSQANPHVHLFFFAPRGSAGKPVAHWKGKGWRGNFVLSAAEQWLKLELTKNFKLIRDLELLPQLLGQDWSSVFLQRFDGTVTIWPRTRFLDWLRILSDPDPPEMARMLHVGQIVTWPKLHMIENRLRLEKQIYLGRQAVRRAQQTPSGVSAITAGKPPVPAVNPVLEDKGLNTGEAAIPVDGLPSSLGTNGDGVPSRLQRLFKRELIDVTPGTSTPEGLQDISDSFGGARLRRKWAEQAFDHDSDEEDDEDENPFSTDAAQQPILDPSSRHPNGSSFLSRLRSQSFQGLSSPFSNLRRNSRLFGKEGSVERAADPSWSSDSSSGDDLSLEEHRHIHHPSIIHIPSSMGRVYPDDHVGGVDHGMEDQVDDGF